MPSLEPHQEQEVGKKKLTANATPSLGPTHPAPQLAATDRWHAGGPLSQRHSHSRRRQSGGPLSHGLQEEATLAFPGVAPSRNFFHPQGSLETYNSSQSMPSSDSHQEQALKGHPKSSFSTQPGQPAPQFAAPGPWQAGVLFPRGPGGGDWG